MAALVDELSHRDHVCLFALDETGIRIESNNFSDRPPKDCLSMRRRTATTRELTS